MDKNKTAPILLIAGIVLFAVAIILLVTKQTQAPQEQTGTPSPQTSEASSQPPSTQPPAKVGPDTVVPDGTALDAFVKKYYDSILKKDFKTAYEMQPASKKATSDAAGFEQSLAGYGITNADVSAAQVSGETAVVEAKLQTKSYGTFTTAWQFTKKGKKWIADSTKTILK